MKKFAIVLAASLCGLALISPSTIFAMENSSSSDHAIFLPQDIKWQDAPDSLPKGAQLAVLEGNPSEAGPFTMRIKMPANYRIPPHWHPIIEHVTIISGTLYIGMGDKFDEKLAKKLPMGSFAFMAPEMHHFAFTHTPAIIQLHGMGPWGITYVNSQDDPRNQKQKNNLG